MQIHQELKTELDELRKHPRDTYEMVIRMLVDHYKKDKPKEPLEDTIDKEPLKIQPDVELPSARTE